ncbi:AAA domain-containing protein [Synechococcus sp. HB1133]|uniref:ATP-dependent Clp protease ATP-binding subunit n=1 Tax=unclassified Synechococcus TaxID=2626047 RepID=UPI00140A81F9|nr:MULTISPECIES: AAA family ATPase [unclassified Synechococcus]MCB4394009.1 AAA domain-containing protein [Synechococcus sp. PH41509]MCB4421744.1 AAA domain-containing protein [Synechococcus sp. HB1133]MCB4430903.1 AAA domain-containing protein [Synechococcus sp. HBA1120]NHI80686.1 AAA family ATPase [Synechococcus sp. HB1133]
MTPSPALNGSLTHEPDRFSDAAWDLLLSGQDVARRWRHEQLDVEHLIQVLFTDPSCRRMVEGLPLPTDALLDRLEDVLADQPSGRGDELFIGDDLEQLLDAADAIRRRWNGDVIDLPELLMAIGADPRIGAELFAGFGFSADELEPLIQRGFEGGGQVPSPPQERPMPPSPQEAPRRQRVARIPSSSRGVREPAATQPSAMPRQPDPLELSVASDTAPHEPTALESYGRDLTEEAEAGSLDPVIGRDSEIRNLIKVLSRRSKNNPVLIGEPGVGKTAIAELLAQRIVAGEVPESLQGLRLVALDLGALIAGAKFRGQFEERLRSVLEEVSGSDSGVVLFIDELHTVVGSDRSSTDAGSLLKPALARGDLRCIGATTPEDYRLTVEKDPALNRRFQQVVIREPDLELSLEILRGLKERYELHHGVTITDEAIQAANRLADRYVSDRCLPDKAIDLIDEAAAQLKMEVTSKPQVVEEAEADLRRVELALLAAEQAPESERIQLQRNRLEVSTRLDDLRRRWQEERAQLEELGQLLQQDEDLRHAIAEAERDGDLEEAARLQYDQLHRVQQRRDELEASQAEAQSSGTALLREQVEAGDIADLVARWTGIPVQRLLAGERRKLLQLDAHLAERVIGQGEAVIAVAAAIRRARAGMKDSRRPVGSFLFLGPTGVGKTELAKALAASLFDEEEALVRLDMSEFMERNAVARLIGAPPGYVGYEEGGQLTEAVRRRPYAVLLLDEVEKAHPDVFNLLLQVLDDGRLTDSQGRTVDFRHTVVVMTSNLASPAILEHARSGSTDESALQQQVDAALSSQFRPEFLNRIDEVIRFRPLEVADLVRIVQLQLKDLAALLAEQGLALRVDDAVAEAMARQGYEPEYGARPLRRVLRRQLENPLSTLLLEERFSGASGVTVRLGEAGSDALVFDPVGV